MTNHWADIDNTSMVLVWGANPVENHPAVAAHMNAARYGNKSAKLVVIDPRLTRTARQINPANGDFFVRIRPGTDIAFGNGVMKWIFENGAAYNPDVWATLLDWHNGAIAGSVVNRSFIADDGSTVSYTNYPKYCDSRFKVNPTGTDYVRISASIGGKTVSNFPDIAGTISDPDCVFQKLKAHVAAYDATTVADICGCQVGDIAAVAKAMLDNSRFASNDARFDATAATPQFATPQDPKYKATTILYAMGQTQHTCGSQNIKNFAIMQTFLGNMGRAGGGINALRGIHNVQGSTDFGLLFDSIHGYSGNPAKNESYDHYVDALFGNRVMNHDAYSGAVDYNAVGNGSTPVPYNNPGALGLQQRGFHNTINEWFGDGARSGAQVAALFDLMPQGNGLQHITSFRKMTSGEIKAAVVWGQNPCISEPNQTEVRKGLENLDLMVCVDMFLNETAACKRKTTGTGDYASGGITYLLPACSYVEEAGSVTNSGRWLQWRERAAPPMGDSKSDLELMLRFAKALDDADAFTHIASKWSSVGITPTSAGKVYTELYAKYGWTPGGATAFEAVPDTLETWRWGEAAPQDRAVVGSEVVAYKLHKEICRPLNDTTTSGGTMWIYSGNGNAAGYYGTVGADVQPGSTGSPWLVKARAKSRNHTLQGASGTNNALNYPRWGWAWLLNRRVFYNNAEVKMDVSDNFVNPGLVSNMFTTTFSDFCEYSAAYRKFKNFADKPSVVAAGGPTTTGPHYIAAGLSLAGRFPGHTEPIESPRWKDLTPVWGYNKGGSGSSELVPGDTLVARDDSNADPKFKASTYPLVLTTIRCVEHFQGGPITRNNSWNVEAEPVPWIEINSVDAAKYNIKDGQYVNIVTARSDTKADQETITSVSGWNKGFKARVGVGLQSNQRVAQGVVAIPWHWGEKGLGTGSRANDLCIDAFDANTMIPEYKACLCRIEPFTPAL